MGDVLRTTVVLGLALVALFVVGKLVFSTEPDHPTNEVDHLLAASGVEAMAHFDPLVPRDLPADSRVTVATFDGNRWFLVVNESDDRFVSLEQVRLSVKSATERAEVDHDALTRVSIDGVDWQQGTDAHGRVALVRAVGDLTILVIGNGTVTQVRDYASSLVPFSTVG